MSNCKSCGNSGCGGNCTKSCIKIYRPTVWRDGQTGIPGEDGAPGVGIVNIIDNMDGTFTIYLSDATDYTIIMPAAAAGKHVVDINPVPGGDSQWELVYDDASTLIISAAYYLNQIGSGVPLLANQVNHPTQIKGLEPKLVGGNSKILVTDDFSDVQFNVKQYGMPSGKIFVNLAGNNAMTQIPPRYETAAGGVAIVAKSGGGDPISNPVTDVYELAIEPIDSYKSILYYRILQSWDLTYNQFSYDNSVKKRFHCGISISLPNAIEGVPLDFFINGDYFNENATTCMYDIYADTDDIESNKLRRYSEGKVCDCILEGSAGGTDPGWIGSGVAGNKLFFRYPFIQTLPDPGGGGDVLKRYKFEAIGSIICHHDSTTDFLSTLPGIKNH